MKQIVITLTILISLTIITSYTYNDNDCYEDIRTGKFYFVQDNGDTLFIERTKKKHIETFNNKKSKLVCNIKWTSYNEFTLVLKSIDEPGCLNKGDKMYVKILECDTQSYKAKITSEDCGSAEVTIMKYLR